ncbi:hypothetical protein Taro_010657 [Colocasia esculenta]|uniref:Uncharacterized protein n=1 Tax=Colocasia esculenta TaxID=4460 RepID=A0A843UDN6_COLES|nr:hypothetical protein [Colocasia esculenta]
MSLRRERAKKASRSSNRPDEPRSPLPSAVQSLPQLCSAKPFLKTQGGQERDAALRHDLNATQKHVAFPRSTFLEFCRLSSTPIGGSAAIDLMAFVLLLLCVLAAAAAGGARAVEYEATNNALGTPGGNRFQAEVGLDYSRQVLADASAFTWDTFGQQNPADRKGGVDRVSLVVETMGGVAYAAGNRIHLSAGYVAGYGGDVRREVTGVLYHEVVHVWQWNGRGAAPGGLVEGIADYVRLKAGYAPSHWVKPGGGNRWDQGYDVTAHFLDYCNGVAGGGFVAALNRKLRDGYSDGFFVELLGKTVQQLWAEYKAKYGG